MMLRGGVASLAGAASGWHGARGADLESVDVAIVGAGVAGLAAAAALDGAGLTVAVLEARGRIGGRAWTTREGPGVPFDRGAAWLHSADENPLTGRLAGVGADIVADDGEARVFRGRQDLGRSAWSDIAAATERLEERAEALLEERDDVPMATAARASTLADRLAAASLGPWEAGVSLDALSARSWSGQIGTGDERLVASGLGSAVARLFATVPVRVSTPVRRVSWGGTRGVVIATDRGEVAARACLVTVPTGVLAAGVVAFDPPLPDEKRAAVAGLPMGLLDKVALRFAPGRLPEPPGTWLLHEAMDGRLSDFLLRPFGSDLAVLFVGAAEAWELEREPPAATVARALAPLTDVYGSALHDAVEAATATRWGRDPWAHGSYSAALPGHAGARAALARPVGDRLFFAGEATEEEWATQVAGAWLSGRRAAQEIGDALGVP